MDVCLVDIVCLVLCFEIVCVFSKQEIVYQMCMCKGLNENKIIFFFKIDNFEI